MRRFLIMAEPITVTAVRGDSIESVHEVHAVALRDGQVVEAAGDASLHTFMRSAAKPIQAMPLARERPDLEPRDVAIASASHLARPDQLDAVRSLLAKAEATEDDLECGAFEGSKLRHNCSGKHAGMLALCRAAGWEVEGYSAPHHPCQQAMLAEVADATGLRPHDVRTAVDGCGVTTFSVPLAAMATAFARLDEPVSSAMRAYPELIRGPGAPDTELMRCPEGWWAKGGAEGVLCAATPEGLALALKVEDGHPRAQRPALALFLERLGFDPAPFGPAELRNSRDDVVGRLVAM